MNRTLNPAAMNRGPTATTANFGMCTTNSANPAINDTGGCNGNNDAS
jgi:hypothetical protein